MMVADWSDAPMAMRKPLARQTGSRFMQPRVRPLAVRIHAHSHPHPLRPLRPYLLLRNRHRRSRHLLAL